MRILILHPNQQAAQLARNSTFAVPGIHFTHACVSGADNVDYLAGMQFAAVVGLEYATENLHPYIKARIRYAGELK